MMPLNRDEYLELYGEAVIYCRVHGRTDIDYCVVCEEEERIDAEIEGEENNDE